MFHLFQVIKMLLAIVVLFAVCWSPTLLDNVLVELGLVNRYHFDHLRYVRQAFSLMSYANSCVNPVVYAFMSRNFRAGFRRALGCHDSTLSSSLLPNAAGHFRKCSPRMRHVTVPADNQGGRRSQEFTLVHGRGRAVTGRTWQDGGTTLLARGTTSRDHALNLAPPLDELPEYLNVDECCLELQ